MLRATDQNIEDDDKTNHDRWTQKKSSEKLHKQLKEEDDESDLESSPFKKGDFTGRLKYSERVRVLDEIDTMPNVLTTNTPESILELSIKHAEYLLKEGQQD